MRRTKALVAVAIALMENPNGCHWGYDLSKQSGIRSGVMYPLLTRLLDQGWLTDGWEDPTSMGAKRPPRRYYQLTESGSRELGAIVRTAANASRGRNGLAPGWAAQ